jgi:hypothetical protein
MYQAFGQTGTLADLVDCPLPAHLGLFHSFQRGIPGFGLGVRLAHRNLYRLTRTRQRSRRLKVGNGLSPSLTALALLVSTLAKTARGRQ